MGKLPYLRDDPPCIPVWDAVQWEGQWWRFCHICYEWVALDSTDPHLDDHAQPRGGRDVDLRR